MTVTLENKKEKCKIIIMSIVIKCESKKMLFNTKQHMNQWSKKVSEVNERGTKVNERTIWSKSAGQQNDHEIRKQKQKTE